MSLKDTWKETGKGLGFAFRDLGKAVIKSAKTGLEQADKWANSDDYPNKEGEAAEVNAEGNPAETNAEATAVEDSPAETKPAE